MKYPVYRSQRLRQNVIFRRMVRETNLSVNDLIMPLFVEHGKNKKVAIKSMPGHYRFSIDNLIKEVGYIRRIGIPAVMLFGITSKKDEIASGAYAKDGIVQKAVREIKNKVPDIVVITDVCLCEYTNHGHCAILKKDKKSTTRYATPDIDHEVTLELLAETALSHAEAGADMVSPSDMMDGRVARIRGLLDSKGYQMVPILAYAVKYASCFYGPFRDAAGSAPQFGDRKSYQLDPANIKEAIREAKLDITEGADILMVKPALAYLDVVSKIKQLGYPVAAYNVSGEFAMIKAAAKFKLLDEKKAVMESLMCIKRAGADMIVTYFAKEIANTLNLKR